MAEETTPKRTNRVAQVFKAVGAQLFPGSRGARVSEAPDSVVSTPPMTDFGSIPSMLDDSGGQRDEPTLTRRVPPPVATQWNADVFSAIEWLRFEAVCTRLFEQAGFRTRLQPGSPDGSTEIWLHSRNAEGPVAILLCRHWLGKNVGVTELREFVNLLTSHQLTRGTFATVATYTPSALRFASDHSINALDSAGLLALIAKRTPAQQQELLDVAYEGEYWRPTCTKCGIKMEERTPSRGGAQFWACSNFPQCKAWLPMAAAKT